MSSLDALPAGYYEQQHLPGAVNLYVEDAAVRAAEVLPDRARRSSPTAPTSPARTAKASRTLTRLGYTDVRTYREGIQDWVEAGLPTESGARAVA